MTQSSTNSFSRIPDCTTNYRKPEMRVKNGVNNSDNGPMNKLIEVASDSTIKITASEVWLTPTTRA